MNDLVACLDSQMLVPHWPMSKHYETRQVMRLKGPSKVLFLGQQNSLL